MINNSAAFAAMMADIASGRARVTEIQLDPSKSLEEQLRDIAGKARAAHRESCSACRTAYEANKATDAAGAEKAERKPAAPPFGAPYGEKKYAEPAGHAEPAEPAKSTWHEIGFMVFRGEQPLPDSFAVDKQAVQAALKQLADDQVIRMINALAGGGFLQDLTIRPVYDKR